MLADAAPATDVVRGGVRDRAFLARSVEGVDAVVSALGTPLLLGRIHDDKDPQEAAVAASGLDWAIVRPGRLVDGPGTGRWREILGFPGERMTGIPRADVAHLVDREVPAPCRRRQVVDLTA